MKLVINVLKQFKNYLRIKLAVLLSLILIQSLFAQTADRITLPRGQDIFLSGMNLAWINFANDLTNFDEVEFNRALDEISAVGGNTVRWWLHVNGSASPTFLNDSVASITQTELQNLRHALNLAQDHQMGLILCLWSFDMMRTSLGTTILKRDSLMLTDSTYLQAYINNALIPMVDAVGTHPALICWEVFNEPEGMSYENGWADIKHVSMADIQKFVNRVAGAIHRQVPGVLVSNGCWSFIAGTDINSYNNYYTDDNLVAAGGDEDGILDFYMVHYYDWGGTAISPFHHQASYWELDKPVVIGEFSAKGPYPGINPEQAYRYLYDNGYAGALSWTWTGHDGNGNVNDAALGMQYLRHNYPVDIVIPGPGVILSFTADPVSISAGDTTLLRWITSTGSRVTLNENPVAQHGSLYVSPAVTTVYKLIASGKSQADTTYIKILLNSE